MLLLPRENVYKARVVARLSQTSRILKQYPGEELTIFTISKLSFVVESNTCKKHGDMKN